MLFYKYQNPTPLALSMLKTGGMFFALPSELNDPSECRSDYQLDGEMEVWERFVYSVFFRGLSHFRDRKHFDEKIEEIIINSSNGIAKHMRGSVRGKAMPWIKVDKAFHDALIVNLKGKIPAGSIDIIIKISQWVISNIYARALNDDVAIASFSLSALNPTMWSHYADSQKGFSIIYESNNGKLSISSDLDVFDGSRPKTSNIGCVIYELGSYCEDEIDLILVKYRNKPPKSNAFWHLSSKFIYSDQEHHYDVPDHFCGTGSRFQRDCIGLTKSTDWKYEREIRALFPAYKPLNSSARSVVINQKHILGVILGPRSSDGLCAHLATGLMSLHSKNNPGDRRAKFFLFKAVEKYGSYDFSLSLIGLVGGSSVLGSIPLIMRDELSEVEAEAGNSLMKRIINGNNTPGFPARILQESSCQDVNQKDTSK